MPTRALELTRTVPYCRCVTQYMATVSEAPCQKIITHCSSNRSVYLQYLFEFVLSLLSSYCYSPEYGYSECTPLSKNCNPLSRPSQVTCSTTLPAAFCGTHLRAYSVLCLGLLSEPRRNYSTFYPARLHPRKYSYRPKLMNS